MDSESWPEVAATLLWHVRDAGARVCVEAIDYQQQKLFGFEVGKPLAGGTTGLPWKWLRVKTRSFMLKVAVHWWQERQKKREKQELAMCGGHNHPRLTHIYDDEYVSYGSLY